MRFTANVQIEFKSHLRGAIFKEFVRVSVAESNMYANKQERGQPNLALT